MHDKHEEIHEHASDHGCGHDTHVSEAERRLNRLEGSLNHFMTDMKRCMLAIMAMMIGAALGGIIGRDILAMCAGGILGFCFSVCAIIFWDTILDAVRVWKPNRSH